MHRAGRQPPRTPSAPLAAAAALAAAGAAGCYRQIEPPPAPPSAPRAPSAEPSWPTSLELTMVEHTDTINHRGLAMFSVETRIPVFHSEPPAVAAALNARIARLARPDVDPRTHEGSFALDCTVRVANRFAVILDCSQELEEHTHEEAEQGAGSLSEGPRPVAIGWWLRRGLPELSVEQFAPRLDLRAAVDEAVAAAPAGCELRACAPDPRSFVLDGDGLALMPTEYCGSECEGALPTIPLEELHPTHAWAEELVTRIRRRVDAGDELVEGERTP